MAASVTTTYETKTKDGKKIAILTLQNHPVNSLSCGVREGFEKAVQNAVKDKADGVIIQGSNHTFCAGADISEFSSGLSGK